MCRCWHTVSTQSAAGNGLRPVWQTQALVHENHSSSCHGAQEKFPHERPWDKVRDKSLSSIPMVSATASIPRL